MKQRRLRYDKHWNVKCSTCKYQGSVNICLKYYVKIVYGQNACNDHKV